MGAAAEEPVLASPVLRVEASMEVVLLAEVLLVAGLLDAALAESVEFGGMLDAGFKGVGDLEQSDAAIFLWRRFAGALG
jgi:hypothetical protein